MDVSVQTVRINTPEKIYCQQIDDGEMDREILSALHNLDYRDGVKGLSPLVADATFNFDLNSKPWSTLKAYVDKLARIALIEDNNKSEFTRYRSKSKAWIDRWHDTLETVSMWAVKYDGQLEHRAEMHDHFPALYTFCYYIEDPFQDLNRGANFVPNQVPPLVIGVPKDNELFSIEVKNGRLVLFRGDVDHGTGHPTKFKGMRYCIGGSVHHIIDRDKFHKDNLGPILPKKDSDLKGSFKG